MFTLLNTVLLIVLIILVSRKKVVVQVEDFRKKDFHKK